MTCQRYRYLFCWLLLLAVNGRLLAIEPQTIEPQTIEPQTAEPALMRVPVPVYQLEFAVFSTDPTLHFDQWSQLQPYSVLIITGVVAVQYFLQQTPGQQFEAVLTIEQALRRLELGRNQLAVLPKFEAEAMLNKLQLKNVSVLSPPLTVEPAYHYLHPKHQSLVEPLTRVLSRLTGQPGEQSVL